MASPNGPQNGLLPQAFRARRPIPQQAMISLVQVLALAVWFSASAVIPAVERDWHITAINAVWLTASVQIGFVAGAIASVAFTLADRMPPHLLLACGAAGAATCTAVLAITVNSLAPAIVLRLLTGVFLATVYPVGMKLMASWTHPATRGRAFGVLLGALTLGSAMPHLIGGLGDLPWRGVMLTSAGLAITAAVLSVAVVRAGPYSAAAPAQANPKYAMAMFLERGPRLINIGYFGHMWELYAFWTWLPAFVIASRGGEMNTTAATSLEIFAAVGVAGVVGCLLGGWAADRWGRPKAAAAALAISGSCCALSPIMFGFGGIPLLIFLLIWGASVIADSGVFSTSLSEAVNGRHVGTALTAQTAFGFLLTVITIQFVPVFAGIVGWQYAFLLLTPGPVLGVLAMIRLNSNQLSKRKDNDHTSSTDEASRSPIRSDRGAVAPDL